MTVSYKTWFSVKLLNDFFNHGLVTDCSVVPSADTARDFFSGTSWLQRFFDDTLYVLIKEDGTGKPALGVPEGKSFRFYLNCTNSVFFNYTNIDARIGKAHVLYLSNFANNEIDSTLNLSQPIPAYSSYAAGHIFFPGDLVTDAGKVYECIFQAVNKLPGDDAFWLERTEKQYVSGADVLKLSPVVYRSSFTDAIKKLTATVKGFRVNGNVLAEYDALIFEQTFANAVTDVQVDLISLAAGRYKIVLEGIKSSDSSVLSTEEIIYYDPEIAARKSLAVIEIFNCINTADAYALRSASDLILETGYTVAFANRNAWWNYITKTDTFPGIDATVVGLSFANPDVMHKQLFVSNQPLPFVKKFDYTPFTVSGTSPPKEIPWPSPAVLKCEKDSGGAITKFFTEIHLNY
jgi:hypothetical protein